MRSADEAQKRVEEMRSWTRGPFRRIESWLLQVISAMMVWIFLRIFNKVHVIGRKRLRRIEPPYLFVSNHLTMFDDFFLGALLFLPFASRGLKYFPWHTPEEQNFFLGPIVTFFMKKVQCVPLTRGHGLFQPGMTRLKELLEDEHVVHIYPEGTRSRTGEIGRGKPGVGRLAYQVRVKVVPCYHEGTQDILPIGRHSLHAGKKMYAIVGDPIDMSDLYDQHEGREVYQAISNRMIEGIHRLRDELHELGYRVESHATEADNEGEKESSQENGG